MKSAYWRSQNTFTSHYLLDITVKKRDNTYGINSLVAATTLIKLWLQASALYMFLVISKDMFRVLRLLGYIYVHNVML